ncbi:MAG: hypothetical protein HQK54_04150 [Oligoflexales bacterium]|nr:hypothetical protein [Oligoflexales bacterium]
MLWLSRPYVLIGALFGLFWGIGTILFSMEILYLSSFEVTGENRIYNADGNSIGLKHGPISLNPWIDFLTNDPPSSKSVKDNLKTLIAADITYKKLHTNLLVANPGEQENSLKISVVTTKPFDLGNSHLAEKLVDILINQSRTVQGTDLSRYRKQVLAATEYYQLRYKIYKRLEAISVDPLKWQKFLEDIYTVSPYRNKDLLAGQLSQLIAPLEVEGKISADEKWGIINLAIMYLNTVNSFEYLYMYPKPYFFFDKTKIVYKDSNKILTENINKPYVLGMSTITGMLFGYVLFFVIFMSQRHAKGLLNKTRFKPSSISSDS